MTNACPSCRPSGSNTIRATMSIVLPALNGMITRIGLAGQLCAQLTRGSAGVMAAAAMSCKWRRRVCCKDIPPLIGHELKAAARACCLTFSLLVVLVPAKSERIRLSYARWSELRLRGTRQVPLLRRDVVGADHLAPELELALEQRGGGFRRLLVGGKHIHAALLEGLAHLGIGERVAQRGVEPLDDRPRRAGGREQHVPEIEIELFVADLAHGRQLRQAGETGSADDGVGLDLAGLDQGAGDHRRYGA